MPLPAAFAAYGLDRIEVETTIIYVYNIYGILGLNVCIVVATTQLQFYLTQTLLFAEKVGIE